MNCCTNKTGLSLVELCVAMLISSFLISAAYKVQVNFSKTASRENDKAKLQRDLMNACNILEKDIRMAGLGLPGNGVQLEKSGTANDKLILHVNKKQLRAKVVNKIESSDTKILIEHTGSIDWGNWVCVENGSIVYREVSRVGISVSGAPDTLYLGSTFNAGPFAPTVTTVYRTDKIVYNMDAEDKKLMRSINKITTPISSEIDSLAIILKDKNGMPLSTAGEAKVITVVMGGFIGNGSNKRFIHESTEVNIRNVN